MGLSPSGASVGPCLEVQLLRRGRAALVPATSMGLHWPVLRKASASAITGPFFSPRSVEQSQPRMRRRSALQAVAVVRYDCWKLFSIATILPKQKIDMKADEQHIALLIGECAINAFRFSCSNSLPCAPPPPPPPPPQQAIRPGFALCESSNGYDWTALPSPLINFNPEPKNPNVEASGVQPLLGPDGKTRWYAFIGAAAWTSIGGKMGMFVYIAVRATDLQMPYCVSSRQSSPVQITIECV